MFNFYSLTSQFLSLPARNCHNTCSCITCKELYTAAALPARNCIQQQRYLQGITYSELYTLHGQLQQWQRLNVSCCLPASRFASVPSPTRQVCHAHNASVGSECSLGLVVLDGCCCAGLSHTLAAVILLQFSRVEE